MIAVDTSALVAIAFDEPERDRFLEIVLGSDRTLIATPTVLETRLVTRGRRGERAVALVDDLLALPVFEQIAPTPADVAAAYTAFVLYGKGSGHPAALNYGDLFSYALAKTRRVPLLFKGDDFTQTDIVPAA